MLEERTNHQKIRDIEIKQVEKFDYLGRVLADGGKCDS